MLPDQVVLQDLGQTDWLAGQVAAQLKPPCALLLYGDLGAGKTTFARSLIQQLTGRDEEVPSPTFTLVQHYEAADGTPIAHFDLYRLKHFDEIYELGWEDALADGMVIVEWPERLESALPRRAMKIYLSLDSLSGHRQARLEGFAPERNRDERY